MHAVSRRDEEHALEHFTAARELVQYEADRMAAIFSAFLLANTLLMGFLLVRDLMPRHRFPPGRPPRGAVP